MSSSERILSTAAQSQAEVDFARKHLAALSSAAGASAGGELSYGREFELEQDERERRVPLVAVRSIHVTMLQCCANADA